MQESDISFNYTTILVAIRCLVYNHEPYLRQCLDGFVMQKTDFPFVAIVHDDASNDGSATIIREYAEKYPGIIRPIYETENQYSKNDGSLSRIMNAAIDMTGAKYIALCEGDDYWTCPEKLQRQVEFMDKNEDVGLCYTDYNILRHESNKIHESVIESGIAKPIESFEEMLFSQAYMAPMTWVVRRLLWNSMCFNIPQTATDGTYCVALEFFANSKVSYCPYNTATYRSHFNSASRPHSLDGVFRYRKGVYDVQALYSERYIGDSRIQFLLKREEMRELVPIAMKIGDTEYLKECEVYAFEHNIDISIFEKPFYFESELEKMRKSIEYRTAKFILAPIKRILKPIYSIFI